MVCRTWICARTCPSRADQNPGHPFSVRPTTSQQPTTAASPRPKPLYGVSYARRPAGGGRIGEAAAATVPKTERPRRGNQGASRRRWWAKRPGGGANAAASRKAKRGGRRCLPSSEMHIPENYLSPQTCAAMIGVMAPVWGDPSPKSKNRSGRTGRWSLKWASAPRSPSWS